MSFDVNWANITLILLVFRSKLVVQGSDGQAGSSWTRGDEKGGHKINDIFIGTVYGYVPGYIYTCAQLSIWSTVRYSVHHK